MSRCLSERALARLYAEGGTVHQRGHLETCPRCRERLNEITRDLAVVSNVLLRTSEPAPRRVRRVPFSLPALTVAGVVASVAIAIWATPRPRLQTAPPRPSMVRSDGRVAVREAPSTLGESLRQDDTPRPGELQDLETAATVEMWCDPLDIDEVPGCDAKGQFQWTNTWESDLGV